jgi:hypothetical protein
MAKQTVQNNISLLQKATLKLNSDGIKIELLEEFYGYAVDAPCYAIVTDDVLTTLITLGEVGMTETPFFQDISNDSIAIYFPKITKGNLL